MLTAVGVAGFALLVMDIAWRYALLLGAIVGSTDAAAVFSSLRHSRVHLNNRVSATLEIESGSNDPMAIFLVVMMIEFLRIDGAPTADRMVVMFLQQIFFGVGGGLGGGYLLAVLLARIPASRGVVRIARRVRWTDALRHNQCRGR